MFEPIAAFNGFSVDDIVAAKTFYGETLGFALNDQVGGTSIQLPGGREAWMYPKTDHQPASYTMLNVEVNDIDAAVDALTAKGVAFVHYPDSYQDAKGIMRGKDKNMGPNIAWFTDPAGNILSVIER